MNIKYENIKAEGIPVTKMEFDNYDNDGSWGVECNWDGQNGMAGKNGIVILDCEVGKIYYVELVK